MCGRFRIEISPGDFMVFYGLTEPGEHDYIERGYVERENEKEARDIYPGTSSLVIKNDGLAKIKWGFPMDKKLIINGRSETVFEKPMFRDSVLERRCIIPAALFYEWNEKRKYTIKTDSPWFYMAGITKVFPDEMGKPEERFLIMTTDADEDMKKLHTRMPVILQKDDAKRYLSSHTPPSEIGKLLTPWNKGLEINLSAGEQMSFMDLQ